MTPRSQPGSQDLERALRAADPGHVVHRQKDMHVRSSTRQTAVFSLGTGAEHLKRALWYGCDDSRARQSRNTASSVKRDEDRRPGLPCVIVQSGIRRRDLPLRRGKADPGSTANLGVVMN